MVSAIREPQGGGGASAIYNFPDPPPCWGKSPKQELELVAEKGGCHLASGEKITITPGLVSKTFSFYA